MTTEKTILAAIEELAIQEKDINCENFYLQTKDPILLAKFMDILNKIDG